MVSGSRSALAWNSAVTLPAVAASACSAAVPSVQVVWARPAELVTADTGAAEPPPAVTENSTWTSPGGMAVGIRHAHDGRKRERLADEARLEVAGHLFDRTRLLGHGSPGASR